MRRLEWKWKSLKVDVRVLTCDYDFGSFATDIEKVKKKREKKKHPIKKKSFQTLQTKNISHSNKALKTLLHLYFFNSCSL